MNSFFKKVIADFKFFMVFAITMLCLTFMYKTQDAKAVTSTTLSGSCGMIFTANTDGWQEVAKTFSATMTNNAIGTINFDNGTFGFKISNVSPYGHATHVDETFEKRTGTFSKVSFDSDTGVYEYTAIDPTDPTEISHVSVLPVNSGNTFLISVYSSTPSSTTGPTSSGVCQKV